MKSAMLFGPFIGSLSWELYYFVPYMIYMKKHNPAYETIVYTRSERFDLYGTYGDILVPLRIKNDRNCIQHRFTINGLDELNYKKMVHLFNIKYKPKYKSILQYYPSIQGDLSSFKWQFPRDQMSYDFSPRVENITKIYNLLKDDYILIDTTGLYLDEAFYFIDELDKKIDKSLGFICYNPNCNSLNLLYSSRDIINLNQIDITNNTSILGLLITSIKYSKYTISVNFSEALQLSLLLGSKVKILREYNKEFVTSINPLNTEILRLDKNIMEMFKL